MLIKRGALPDKTRPKRRVAVAQIDLARVAGRDERRPLRDGAVTVDAGGRRRVARLAVELAVAVDVGEEMAIDALHAVREMHIFQVHRFGEFLRVVMRDRMIVEVEHGAFAVVFEDGAKDPAVPVVVGKLGVLELRI